MILISFEKKHYTKNSFMHYTFFIVCEVFLIVISFCESMLFSLKMLASISTYNVEICVKTICMNQYLHYIYTNDMYVQNTCLMYVHFHIL